MEFVDNQECVDLIEARPPAGVGILSLLDEECMVSEDCGVWQWQPGVCRNACLVHAQMSLPMPPPPAKRMTRPAALLQMPKGSDSTFAAKLQQQQAAHPRFSYNTRAPGDDFTIQVCWQPRHGMRHTCKWAQARCAAEGCNFLG